MPVYTKVGARKIAVTAREPRNSYVRWLPLASFLISVSSLLATILHPNAIHWSLIPISVCGILLVTDVIRVAADREDILGPRSVVALFAVYFFYVAPLANLMWDYWPRYVPGPADWRAALGLSAWINVAGILVFLCSVSLKSRLGATRRYLSQSRFRIVALLGIVFGFGCWLIASSSFGGPFGYLQALWAETADLRGFGTILVAAEAWPSLALALTLVLARELLARRPWMLVGVFLAFVLLQFAVGGLRGSRALMVWPLLIGLTICHLVVRRLRVRVIVCIALAIIAFAGVYAFYKSSGEGVVDLFTGQVTAGELSQETGRDIETLATEDFGRAGVQALAAYHVTNGAELAYGETYLGNIQIFLPSFIELPELSNKTDIITQMFYGVEASREGFQSSRILGLGGEAMVNFGVPGVLLAFFMYGRLIAFGAAIYDRSLRDKSDLRGRLLAATLPSMGIIALISDLDNVILFCLKYALPLVMAVWASSRTLAKVSGQHVAGRSA